MKKLFNLLGIKVLSSCKETLGTICDFAITNESLPKIFGLLLDTENETLKDKYLLWEDLNFGQNVAILTSSWPSEIPKNELKEDSDKIFLLKNLINLKVYTNDGTEMGILKDMFISEKDGLVECLQCSDGIINDIFNGRTIYPILSKIEIDKNNITMGKESLEEAINRDEMEVGINE